MLHLFCSYSIWFT